MERPASELLSEGEAEAFADVPCTARGHFLLNFYAAVYRLVNYVRCLSNLGGDDLKQTFIAFPFLSEYFAEAYRQMPPHLDWHAALLWWKTEIARWEAARPDYLPLCALEEQAGLTYEARLALMIVGLVEEDSRFGALFARLQEPLAYRRPCLELVGQIVRKEGVPGATDAWGLCRPMLTQGLLDVANREAPRSEWVLRVPAVLWDGMRGDVAEQPAPWCRRYQPGAFPPLNALVLPDEFTRRLAQVPVLISAGRVGAVVLRGTPGSERLEVMGAIADSLGRGLIEVDPIQPASERHWELLGPLCSLTHSLPVFTCDLGPGETAEIPALNGYRGPVGVLAGLEGGLSGRGVEKAVTLVLPFPDAEERLRGWQAALDGSPVENLPQISDRFHLPGGYIRQAARIAIAHAGLERREQITFGDVREACRTLNRQLLDTLATRLDGGGTWDHLVTSETTAGKLGELERRCRYRERLLDFLGAGFEFTSNRGVRALFTGASGTGKTLAARILADELGMDLYRVDLAAVVNKYIGETEKNLSRVLSRAEELDVILLLDEGDTLLGRRTEVRTANDRYANLETNYLLQRLENYQGLIIVTTNAAESIDSAFERRMDVVVHFLPPQAQERWHIWQLHLPPEHRIDAVTLEDVALRCALTGGQIRNAALHTTLLAMGRGGGIVTWEHLEQAVRSEYRKMGATSPLFGERNGSVGAPPPHSLDALRDALSF